MVDNKPLTTEQASKMVRDIATNSYEVGYRRGFAEAKRRARNIGLGALLWVVVLVVTFFLLTGCTPYAGFIAGYSEDGGDYFTYWQEPIREDGGSAIAYLGARREVSEHFWLLCQGTHFSTFTNRPEVAVNHIGCGFEIR